MPLASPLGCACEANHEMCLGASPCLYQTDPQQNGHFIDQSSSSKKRKANELDIEKEGGDNDILCIPIDVEEPTEQVTKKFKGNHDTKEVQNNHSSSSNGQGHTENSSDMIDLCDSD